MWALGWSSGDSNVFFKVYDVSGCPTTNEVQANEIQDGGNRGPAMASLGNDRFVVVWEARHKPNGYNSILGRVFELSGQPVAEEFQCAAPTP